MKYITEALEKPNINDIIEFLAYKLKNNMPAYISNCLSLGYKEICEEYFRNNMEIGLCLGFLSKSPEISLVISRRGLYLVEKYGDSKISMEVPKEEYHKYEKLIVETIKKSKKEKLPLWTDYLENSKYSKFFE
jgi:hypothetical protein